MVYSSIVPHIIFLFLFSKSLKFLPRGVLSCGSWEWKKPRCVPVGLSETTTSRGHFIGTGFNIFWSYSGSRQCMKIVKYLLFERSIDLEMLGMKRWSPSGFYFVMWLNVEEAFTPSQAKCGVCQIALVSISFWASPLQGFS